MKLAAVLLLAGVVSFSAASDAGSSDDAAPLVARHFGRGGRRRQFGGNRGGNRFGGNRGGQFGGNKGGQNGGQNGGQAPPSSTAAPGPFALARRR